MPIKKVKQPININRTLDPWTIYTRFYRLRKIRPRLIVDKLLHPKFFVIWNRIAYVAFFCFESDFEYMVRPTIHSLFTIMCVYALPVGLNRLVQTSYQSYLADTYAPITAMMDQAGFEDLQAFLASREGRTLSWPQHPLVYDQMFLDLGWFTQKYLDPYLFPQKKGYEKDDNSKTEEFDLAYPLDVGQFQLEKWTQRAAISWIDDMYRNDLHRYKYDSDREPGTVFELFGHPLGLKAAPPISGYRPGYNLSAYEPSGDAFPRQEPQRLRQYLISKRAEAEKLAEKAFADYIKKANEEGEMTPEEAHQNATRLKEYIIEALKIKVRLEWKAYHNPDDPEEKFEEVFTEINGKEKTSLRRTEAAQAEIKLRHERETLEAAIDSAVLRRGRNQRGFKSEEEIIRTARLVSGEKGVERDERIVYSQNRQAGRVNRRAQFGDNTKKADINEPMNDFELLINSAVPSEVYFQPYDPWVEKYLMKMVTQTARKFHRLRAMSKDAKREMVKNMQQEMVLSIIAGFPETFRDIPVEDPAVLQEFMSGQRELPIVPEDTAEVKYRCLLSSTEQPHLWVPRSLAGTRVAKYLVGGTQATDGEMSVTEVSPPNFSEWNLGDLIAGDSFVLGDDVLSEPLGYGDYNDMPDETEFTYEKCEDDLIRPVRIEPFPDFPHVHMVNAPHTCYGYEPWKPGFDVVTNQTITGFTHSMAYSTKFLPTPKTAKFIPTIVPEFIVIHWFSILFWMFTVRVLPHIRSIRYFKKPPTFPVRQLQIQNNPYRLRHTRGHTADTQKGINQIYHWITMYPLRKVYLAFSRFPAMVEQYHNFRGYPFRRVWKKNWIRVVVHCADYFDIFRWLPCYLMADFYGCIFQFARLNINQFYYFFTHLHSTRKNDQNLFIFVGTTGSGKTFLAQCIAGECRSNLFSLDAEELLHRPKRDKGEATRDEVTGDILPLVINNLSRTKLIRFLWSGRRMWRSAIILFENFDRMFYYKKMKGANGRSLFTYYKLWLDKINHRQPNDLIIHTTSSLKDFTVWDLAENVYGTTVWLTLPSLEGRVNLLRAKLDTVYKPGKDWTNDAYMFAAQMPRFSANQVSRVAMKARRHLVLNHPRDPFVALYDPKAESLRTDVTTVVNRVIQHQYAFYERRGQVPGRLGSDRMGPIAATKNALKVSLRPPVKSPFKPNITFRKGFDVSRGEITWKRSKLMWLKPDDLDRLIPSRPWEYPRLSESEPTNPYAYPTPGERRLFWHSTLPDNSVTPPFAIGTSDSLVNDNLVPFVKGTLDKNIRPYVDKTLLPYLDERILPYLNETILPYAKDVLNVTLLPRIKDAKGIVKKTIQKVRPPNDGPSGPPSYDA